MRAISKVAIPAAMHSLTKVCLRLQGRRYSRPAAVSAGFHSSRRQRREKKAEREQRAQDNALTFRQRLGVSLSKLSQPELDQVVSGLAHRGNANALARLADQAFGRPLQADEDKPEDEGLASLTREERAVLRQMLEAGVEPDEPDSQVAEEQSPSARGRRQTPTE